LKNSFVVVMLAFIIAALIPWMWLSNEYGLNNIPHYDIQMWIFMELYALIVGITGLGIVLVALDGEDKPKRKHKTITVKKSTKPKQKTKTIKEKTKSKQKTKTIKEKTKSKQKTKAEKKAAADGSYLEPSVLPGTDEKTENGAVVYPAAWDEEVFE